MTTAQRIEQAIDELKWITDRKASGTVWKLFKGSHPTGVSIFKSHLGYVLNQDEYPLFKKLNKAKDEAVRRYRRS